MKTITYLSDTELLDLLPLGDQKAYTKIYAKYSKPLYLFALSRLGDAEECRDIVQDIFLSLWNRKETLNIETNLSGYLLRAVRNKIIDAINKRKVADFYVESFYKFLDRAEDNTDHLVRHNELAQLITDEVEKLPVKMREVFELSRKASLTRKEIALTLGISEQTVKSHMQHALKILKKSLGLSSQVLAIFFYFEKYFKNF